jgi:hypothetical protein
LLVGQIDSVFCPAWRTQSFSQIYPMAYSLRTVSGSLMSLITECRSAL